MGLLKSIRKRIRNYNLEKSLKNLPITSLEHKKKGLFIDCGSNLGQGYTFFKDYFKPEFYDTIMIEPNPNCMKVVKEKFQAQKNITFLEVAAWINTDTLQFFGLVEDDRGATSDGGSVVADHNGVFYEADKQQSIDVPAISLANLIIEKSKDYDQIIIKMDIESAEYEVLKDILKTKASQHVTHMYIEFHSQYFKEEEQASYVDLEKNLIKQLKSDKVGVSLWH